MYVNSIACPDSQKRYKESITCRINKVPPMPWLDLTTTDFPISSNYLFLEGNHQNLEINWMRWLIGQLFQSKGEKGQTAPNQQLDLSISWNKICSSSFFFTFFNFLDNIVARCPTNKLIIFVSSCQAVLSAVAVLLCMLF